MTMRILTPVLLGVAIVAQLAVPASMIVRREAVLRHGVALRFRTAPVDPADAFRGRYVALGFDECHAPADETFQPDRWIYVRAEVGTNGFAQLTRAARAPDTTGVWFRASSGYSSETNAVTVHLPFDRFYMEERSAPRAETLYRDVNRRNRPAGEQRTCWLQVRVYRGMAVAEELYIDGLPVREALRQAK